MDTAVSVSAESRILIGAFRPGDLSTAGPRGTRSEMSEDGVAGLRVHSGRLAKAGQPLPGLSHLSVRALG